MEKGDKWKDIMIDFDPFENGELIKDPCPHMGAPMNSYCNTCDRDGYPCKCKYQVHMCKNLHYWRANEQGNKFSDGSNHFHKCWERYLKRTQCEN